MIKLYTIIGAIVFWIIIASITSLFIIFVFLPVAEFIHHKVIQRTYLFQWIEYCRIKRAFSKKIISAENIKYFQKSLLKKKYKHKIFLHEYRKMIQDYYLTIQQKITDDEKKQY